MSNLDKNIIITTNIGSSTDDPKIVFSAAILQANHQNITLQALLRLMEHYLLKVLGQLFSVTNQLTGSIFSVNDISGIQDTQVQDTGQIQLAQSNGYVPGIRKCGLKFKYNWNRSGLRRNWCQR
jgi:hypothetical protein